MTTISMNYIRALVLSHLCLSSTNNHSFLIQFGIGFSDVFVCSFIESAANEMRATTETKKTHTHQHHARTSTYRLQIVVYNQPFYLFWMLSLASTALGNFSCVSFGNWLSRAFHIDSWIYTSKLHGLIFILLDIIIYAVGMKWICLN